MLEKLKTLTALMRRRPSTKTQPTRTKDVKEKIREGVSKTKPHVEVAIKAAWKEISSRIPTVIEEFFKSFFSRNGRAAPGKSSAKLVLLSFMLDGTDTGGNMTPPLPKDLVEKCPMSQQLAYPCGRRTVEVCCAVISQALRAQQRRRDVKKSRRPDKFDVFKPQCLCKKVCRCPDEDYCKCKNVCMCKVICKCKDACTCGGNCKCENGCTCKVICKCEDCCNCEDLCDCDSICELNRALPDPTLLDLPAATSDQKKAVFRDEDVSGDKDVHVSGEDKDVPDCATPKRPKKNAQGLKAQLKKEYGGEYRKKWNGRKPDEKEPASGPQVDAPGTNDCTDLFDHDLASQDRPLEEWLKHL